MTKKYLLIGAIIFCAAALGAGIYFYNYQIKQSQQTPVLSKIRIGYSSNVSEAPTIIALEKAFFQKHGLESEALIFNTSKEMRMAMTANQVDVGAGGLTNFLAAMESGAPLRNIAASSASPAMVFVRPDGKINSFADLYGKTICANQTGINNLIFRSIMSKENIDVKKMNFTEIDKEYLAVALMEKKVVDAVIISDQDTELMIRAGAIVLPEWENKGYSNRVELRSYVVADTDFLNQNQSVVEKYLDACIEASNFIRQNPKEAAQIVSDHIMRISDGAIYHDPKEIVSQWENKKTVNLLWRDPSEGMKLADKAAELGLVKRKLSVDEIFDLRFQNKLEKAQKEVYGE